jgi:iron uptake system component EfeO
MSGYRRLLAGTIAVAVPLAVAGCVGSGGSTAGSNAASRSGAAVRIELTDDGCTPTPASVPAGALSFSIANKGASRVTETEIMQDGRILGERENLTPGLSGSLSLRLEPGQYVVYCPNAKTDRSTLTVTGSGTGAADASLVAAVASYRAFVQDEVNQLVPATRAFVAAVKAGDIRKARAMYAPARTHYESIEPVAESFGDLDPQIDARAGDVASPSQWTGFHRIEKALWADNSLPGMASYGNLLLADVTKLQRLVPTARLQPAAIANGAVELLGEVANSKITGEEDRYSHTDLWDFEANVAGVREAVDVLTPALRQRNPALLTTIQRQLATVLTTLSRYKTSSGYASYTTVTTPERRSMTTQVNALAETLSKVAPAIV